MAALARQGDVVEANALLHHMKQGYVLPDQVTYTSVLHAYAHSQDPEKVEKAYALVHEAAMNHSSLDTFFTVAFLQVCAHALPSEKELALDLVCRVFESLEPRKRNQYAYLNMAKAINNLVGNGQDKQSSSTRSVAVAGERQQLTRALAKECCGAGYLSAAILKEMERNANDSTGTVQNWLGSGSLRPEWSRKVPMEQRPKSRRR
jgi:pentatricopeptide repeat protein